MRSNLGKVVSNPNRRRLRRFASIWLWQVSKRSQVRRAWGSTELTEARPRRGTEAGTAAEVFMRRGNQNGGSSSIVSKYDDSISQGLWLI